MKILVIGGAGFIGSNFIRHILSTHPTYQIINLDKLTYAGNLDNLDDIQKKYPHRYQFIKGDICNRNDIKKVIPTVVTIVNFAAETHVDRSIHLNQGEFIQTDVIGIFILLEAIRKHQNIQKLIQISTDEVYGDIACRKKASEKWPINPSNPYSASKAGADLQIMAYLRTYHIPAIIVRCSNNYGPFMHPEKIIPLFITNLLEEKKIPLYGTGAQIRDWIYVEDHCHALDIILHKGIIGEIYNIAAENKPEISNLILTQKILKILNKDSSYIRHVDDRPGHDQRYSATCAKIKKLGWSKKYSFNQGLTKTIQWYQEHKSWWKKIKEGEEYKSYYLKMTSSPPS